MFDSLGVFIVVDNTIEHFVIWVRASKHFRHRSLTDHKKIKNSRLKLKMVSRNLVSNSALVVKRRLVLSITRMTIHNGPGIRTLILFKGCPLRCLWCSTPECQVPEPEIAIYPSKCTHCGYCVPVCTMQAINLTEKTISIDRALCNKCGECIEVCCPQAIQLLGQYMSVEELTKELKKDAVIYKHSGGGITISGGEPLLDPDFTRQFLRSCKEEGISVGVDTCGHVPWENIERMLPYIDFFLWDIKHMNPEKHEEFTGVSNKLILNNVQSVSERGIPLYIRVPVIPGYNDSEDNIRATCDFVRSLSSVVEVDLLPLHHLGKARYQSLERHYPIDNIPLVPDEELQNMKLLVESYGLACNIVG